MNTTNKSKSEPPRRLAWIRLSRRCPAASWTSPPRSWAGDFARIAVLALGYFAVSWAAEVVNAFPNHPSFIWPAAGVALSALLVWGVRVWPGILIGNILASWSFHVTRLAPFPIDSADPPFGLIAWFGLGATVQALFGWFLIICFAAPPTSRWRERRFLWTLLICGPISCLVNSIWSLVGTEFVNGWPTSLETLAQRILIWWIGDSVGLLLVTPGLVLAAYDNDPRQRRGLLWCPLLVLLVISVFLAAMTSFERTQRHQFLELESEHLASRLANHVRELEHLFGSLVTEIARQPRIDQEALDALGQKWFASSQDVARFAWFANDEESNAEAGSILFFDHSRMNNSSRWRMWISKSDPRIEAIRRQPPDGERTLWFSGNDPRSAQEFNPQYGIWLIQPVFDGRNQTLRGWCVAELNPERIIERFLNLPEMDPEIRFQVRLLDLGVATIGVPASPSDASVLFVRGRSGRDSLLVAVQPTPATFTFADRVWRLEVRPLTAAVADQFSSTVLLLSMAGLGVAISLQMGFILLIGRTRTTRDLIFRRTRALKHALAEAERATRKANADQRAKSAFLANMSHEIRTPLTAILGYARILRDQAIMQGSDSISRDSIRSILRNGDHLLRLINDILDLSKLEANSVRVEPLPTSPLEIVKEVLVSHSRSAFSKNISLSARTATSIPAQILVDPTRLRQILHNLVSNAVKFTEQGEIEVILGVETHEESSSIAPSTPFPNSNDSSTGTTSFMRNVPGRDPTPTSMGSSRRDLVIAVRDTGMGIDPADQAVLFQPFQQGRRLAGQTNEGTGLGLSISRRLARLMGGDLTVTSSPGFGSTFELRIPLDLATLPASLEKLGWIQLPQSLIPRQTSQRSVVLDFSSLAASPSSVPVALAKSKPDDVSAPKRDSQNQPPPDPKLEYSLPSGSSTLFQGRRVLLVEDTPDNRRVISYSLKRLGLVVETAENGELGVERVLAEPEGFDLVLMDISMPVMDGRQAVKILRERKFTLPIVALTAHALEEERERCLREGFDEYLAKPFSSRDLKTILERVWTKREERVSKPKVRDESDLEVGPIGEFLPS